MRRSDAVWDAVGMNDIIWIERLGDETWGLRIAPTGDHPAGRVERLSRFVSLDDEASLVEIDEVVSSWGWRREGLGYRDELGKLQIPVAPTAG